MKPLITIYTSIKKVFTTAVIQGPNEKLAAADLRLQILHLCLGLVPLLRKLRLSMGFRKIGAENQVQYI
jgi:hypothetical protein